MVVLDITTAEDEGVGTAQYNLITSRKVEMAAAFPNEFMDVGRYLVDHALTHMGVTPPPKIVRALQRTLWPRR